MKFILLLTAALLASAAFSTPFDDAVEKAEAGDVMTQFNLGLLYYNGEDVPENLVNACLWWLMAKTQGDEGAKGNLEILKPQMAKQQIADAQTLAAKCYESNYKDCG